MTFLGVVVFRDNQNTVFFPTAPEYGELIHAEHTPAEPPIAVAAVLTAVTLTACSSGDGARNAVAVGGTFQFHSPGGQTEIIYAEEERGPLPDFSGPSLMGEGEKISLSDFEGEVVVLNAWGQGCAPCPR